jgi:hypothetical protein
MLAAEPTMPMPTKNELAALLLAPLMGLVAPMGLVALMSAPMPAQAQEPFFARKTITISIGYTAGGSYDLYGRLVARHIGKHIPGQPIVVAQNMPGTGSLKAAAYVYEVAPKDGTALGVVVESAALEQALGNPAAQYDAARFTYVGRVATSNNIFMQWHTSKVQSIEDSKKFESSLAGTGPGSIAETVPRLINALAGTKFRLVSGYPASNEAMLAMERGEVEGASSSWAAVSVGKKEWLRDKKDPHHPADRARTHQGSAGRARAARDRDQHRGQASLPALRQRQCDRPHRHCATQFAARARENPARCVQRNDQGPGLHRRHSKAQRRARSAAG